VHELTELISCPRIFLILKEKPFFKKRGHSSKMKVYQNAFMQHKFYKVAEIFLYSCNIPYR